MSIQDWNSKAIDKISDILSSAALIILGDLILSGLDNNLNTWNLNSLFNIIVVIIMVITIPICVYGSILAAKVAGELEKEEE